MQPQNLQQPPPPRTTPPNVGFPAWVLALLALLAFIGLIVLLIVVEAPSGSTPAPTPPAPASTTAAPPTQPVAAAVLADQPATSTTRTPQNHPARDGIRFEDQPADVQATFVANYGDDAANEWVREHSAEPNPATECRPVSMTNCNSVMPLAPGMSAPATPAPKPAITAPAGSTLTGQPDLSKPLHLIVGRINGFPYHGTCVISDVTGSHTEQFSQPMGSLPVGTPEIHPWDFAAASNPHMSCSATSDAQFGGSDTLTLTVLSYDGRKQMAQGSSPSVAI
jgi:hypothetical protein